MPYCTNTDVQAEFKGLVYNSNSVTSAKVDEWILQADAYINSYLSSQYVVPVTGTESLKVLKMISIWIVADRVRDVLTLLPGASQGSQEFAKDYWKMATEMLSDIKKGKLNLTDAVFASAGGGVEGFAAKNNLEPEFKRYRDDW